MIILALLVTFVVVIYLYYIMRRLALGHIYASLIAAEIVSPGRVKQVEGLLAKPERLEKDGQDKGKEYERVEDQIAALNPMCVYGRREQCLLETAWEIYKECGWRNRRVPLARG